ncbi:hypothetical protein LOK49_LG02G00012 [Camellia lanceoleosa]|uniref:Uncharacterized protein n=1 Tax=Camellia lanceoleosa TaxID=1840588 RepID=A0ACC0IHI7_9ERIC|nr:hypothetical protein LOK49_LG02G00012 [Camellia lanceoleosa]
MLLDTHVLLCFTVPMEVDCSLVERVKMGILSLLNGMKVKEQ